MERDGFIRSPPLRLSPYHNIGTFRSVVQARGTQKITVALCWAPPLGGRWRGLLEELEDVLLRRLRLRKGVESGLLQDVVLGQVRGNGCDVSILDAVLRACQVLDFSILNVSGR